ncbi:hypothetical protein VNI00_007599 [Paramarasmius palmivorus]|uniref:Cytochrome P450 n=1 Tax=Paramarasmius palmivorus TaxID=297713 RepID=A0AAW0D459_9AGAR
MANDAMNYDEPKSVLSMFQVVFGPGVLSTPLGAHHRKQRKMLNPAFSIAHMKEQIPIFYGIARKVRDTLVRKVQDGPKEVDVSSWMGRTALELIGQSGLGYSFDDLEDQIRHDPFAHAIKALTLLPWWKDLQATKFFADELWRMSTEIFEARVKALEMGDDEMKRQTGGGKDLMSLLIKENMKATGEDRLSKEELLAQVNSTQYYDVSMSNNDFSCTLTTKYRILINAATDTTSTALSQTLQLLATHPDVQRRLREEVDEAFQDGDASYERLVSLPLLDAICRETLRLYPPISKLVRIAKHDVVLPLSTPVVGIDGSAVTEILVPKNTEIHCSIINEHRNPDIWGPDAAEWKPERWMKPLSRTVTDASMPGVYSNLMTFSAGQRSCIGFKFSQLEMKVVLALLIQEFEFSDAGKAVSWDLTMITSPTIDGQPRMPVVMGLVKGPQ